MTGFEHLLFKLVMVVVGAFHAGLVAVIAAKWRPILHALSKWKRVHEAPTETLEIEEVSLTDRGASYLLHNPSSGERFRITLP